ncbi:MAG: hypothetical protein WBX25_30515 [Rhodomicrobium sp.]
MNASRSGIAISSAPAGNMPVYAPAQLDRLVLYAGESQRQVELTDLVSRAVLSF